MQLRCGMRTGKDTRGCIVGSRVIAFTARFAAAAVMAGGGLLLGSCSSGAGALAESSQPPDVALNILDETFVDGLGEAKFTHSVAPSGDGYAVEVSAVDAKGLRALFFELEYDAARWHPAGAEVTGLLDTADNLLSISDTSSPGVVSHGQVVPNYDTHPGFSGSGTLARIELAPGPAQNQRTVSALGKPLSEFPFVFIDYYSKTMQIYYNIQGDYDQNGEVNAADLVPLSLFFGNRPGSDQSPRLSEDGTFQDDPQTGFLYYVDGNGDGEVNQSDITTIAMNFGRNIEGFAICGSPDYAADYPLAGTMTAGSAEITSVPLPPPSGNYRQERVCFELNLPEMDYLNHYWVHAQSGAEFSRAGMVALDIGDYPPAFEKNYGLQYDAESGVLSWNSNLRGDSIQDSEVNVSDLDSIALNFGSHGPFEPDSLLWIADGNRDGKIDLYDIVIIKYTFGKRDRYRIYATELDSEIPQSPTDPETIEPLNLPGDGFFERTRLPDTGRMRVSTEVQLDSGTYVWLRLYNPNGGTSPRSEVIQIP